MTLYIIINNVNGKLYAGKTTLTGKAYDNYNGSGTILKRAYKKYGIENFTKRKCKIKITNIDDLNRLEIILIRRLHKKFPKRLYNMHEGGNGGYLCMYMEDRLWVNKRISEGKRKQYAKGQTAQQLEGRKKQSISLKLKYNDSNFKERHDNANRLKGRKLSARVRVHGLTDKEKERNARVKLRNTRHVTYQLVYPDNKIVQETKTVGDFMSHYHTEKTVMSSARKNTIFIFKRRTSRTKHNFPKGTKLIFISELKPRD